MKYQILNGDVSEVFEIKFSDNAIIVYEVLRLIKGKPLFLKEHFERLKQSVVLVSQEYIPEMNSFRIEIEELAKVNKTVEGNVMIRIVFQENKSTRIVSLIPHKYPSIEMYQSGVELGVLNAERTCPEAKVVNRELRNEANRMIEENGLFEILFVDNEMMIREGSRSNFFAIKNGEIYTAPFSKVLKGVTLSKVLEIALNKEIPVNLQQIDIEELANYDAAFITGTSPKVMPVAKILDTKFNVDNAVLRILMQEYNILVDCDIQK